MLILGIGTTMFAGLAAESGLSKDDFNKAVNDLNTVFTAMHVGVAGAV